MLITDDFIYIHMPKTGGTFVTDVITRLHESAVAENVIVRLVSGIRGRKRLLSLIDIQKHGTCSEIPREYRGRTILATIRNPYDRYVSIYEFGLWRSIPDFFGSPEIARQVYPHFPNLSFAEFVHLAMMPNWRIKNTNFAPEESLGRQTRDFVRYFFHNPGYTFSAIDQPSIQTQQYKEYLFDNIHFIHTNNLNRELADFLISIGYAPSDLAFILQKDKVFPPRGGRTEKQPWQAYYTPELKQEVRTRDRLVFDMFAEFDV